MHTIEINKIMWNQVNSSGSKRSHLNPNESLWIWTSPNESKWCPSEAMWIHMSPIEFKGIQMNPIETRWVHSETKWVPPLPPILLSNFSWPYRYILRTLTRHRRTSFFLRSGCYGEMQGSLHSLRLGVWAGCCLAGFGSCRDRFCSPVLPFWVLRAALVSFQVRAANF